MRYNYETEYRINDLIFESELEYQMLKSIDDNADLLVQLCSEGLLSINDYFGCYMKVGVREARFNAVKNIDVLFPNIARLFHINDPDCSKVEFNFCDSFYNLIRIEV